MFVKIKHESGGMLLNLKPELQSEVVGVTHDYNHNTALFTIRKHQSDMQEWSVYIFNFPLKKWFCPVWQTDGQSIKGI
jgi:hypothetical protein